MGYIKRSIRTQAKRAKKFVKQRYGFNKKSSGLNLGTMANDVMMLKKMVNAEKKTYQNVFSINSVGQVNGQDTGALCLDITPYVQQGVAVDQRTGNSFKLTSALYEFQLNQQSSLQTAQHLIFEWWSVKGTQLSSADALTYLFQPATFSGVIDNNSPRNQDRFNDFRLLRRVKKTLVTDAISGASSTLTFKVPFKFNKGKGHHIRMVPNPTGVISDILNGQIFMTVRADVGNKSGTTLSLKPVPITAIFTGSTFRLAYRVWYYDN